MAIRHATAADRAAVEALWEYCFEKRTEPFFGFYFGSCWRPEETLMYETESGMAAALHLRRYRLRVRGVVCPVTYIVGLATHPAARGKGYARALVEAALAETTAEGAFANILMPSAAAFYLPQGYAMYCHQWERSCRLADVVPERTETRYEWLTEAASTKVLAQVYETYTKGFSGYAVRDAADWSRWLRGYLAEGHVVVVHAADGPVGYVTYTPGETIHAGETVWLDERGRRSILALFARHRDSAERLVYRTALAEMDWLDWPDGAERTVTTQRTYPFMMVRPAAFRSWWRKFPVQAQGKCVLAIADGDGMRYDEVNTTGDAVSIREVAPQAAVQVTAADWACVLIGRVTAADLAKRGKLQGSAADIALLTEMYPRMDTWINEWY